MTVEILPTPPVDVPEEDTSGTAYASIAEAQVYMDGVIYSDAWDSATTVERTKALLNATRLIDRLNFLGTKNDEDQDLQFPRYDDTSVPTDIKYASAAIANALLDGVDPEIEFQNLKLLQAGLSGAKSTYDRDSTQPQTADGIGSFTAWTFLKPYIVDPGTVEIHHV